MRIARYVYYGLYKRHIYALTAPIRVLPDLIVIGVVRGGTTSLYHYLGDHPCIIRSSYDEIGFFDSNYHLGVTWYRSFFPTKIYAKYIKWKHKQFLTYDVTPFYIFNPVVVSRIRSLLPNVKLIAVLRNPVDRAYSNYYLGVRSGNEKRTFEEAIVAEFEKIESYEKPKKTEEYFEQIVSRSYVARGFYADQLQNWLDRFPKEQLFVVSSEALGSKTQETLSNIFEFLKLPNCKIKNLKKRNEAKYPLMKDATREILSRYFKPHNEKLFALLGYRFDWNDN